MVVVVVQGCYVGQETLAKVSNLDAVRQQLWGLQLQGPVATGVELTNAEGSKVGRMTLVATLATGDVRGLGYVCCKVRGKQLDVEGEWPGSRGGTQCQGEAGGCGGQVAREARCGTQSQGEAGGCGGQVARKVRGASRSQLANGSRSKDGKWIATPSYGRVKIYRIV